MSDSDEGAKPSKVGYRNPPRHSQFKPGQSGNPRGRPRGPRNIATEIQRVMDMPVPVTANGRRKHVSTVAASLLRLREMALSGNLKALQHLLTLGLTHLGQDRDATSLSALLAEDAAILADAGLRSNQEDGDGVE